MILGSEKLKIKIKTYFSGEPVEPKSFLYLTSPKIRHLRKKNFILIRAKQLRKVCSGHYDSLHDKINIGRRPGLEMHNYPLMCSPCYQFFFFLVVILGVRVSIP